MEKIIFLCNWWHCIFLVATAFHMAACVEIRRLSVPRWVQNGTEDSVVLDCEYVWNENDFRLVVKWFFKDNLEPVYQWIPELNLRHTSGVLQNRLDMDFSVNTVDAYSRFRALRIPRPSTELSGKYTCLVTSLAGQDSREQIMTVFVPANEFELSYLESACDLVNVTCDAQGAYPLPELKLLVRPSNGSPPQTIQDVKTLIVQKSNGAYDVHVERTFSVSDLPPNVATVFECLLELPGTNYLKAKRIAYFPGIQSSKLDIPLTSCAKILTPLTRILTLVLWSAFYTIDYLYAV